MKTLSQTWFADGYIDFELKKYTLLAYLQQIHQCFTQNKLYPQLADVIFHYNNLVSFKENKQLLQNQFPKRLTGLQMEKLQLLYKAMVEDDELMLELEAIINYSTGTMQRTISSGTEIYEFVEQSLTIEPVGIVPLDNKEGYFFLSSTAGKSLLVYQYQISLFEKADARYRALKTSFISEWQRSFVNTYQNIKTELIRTITALPNPAVYAVETKHSFPVEETLLPVARRSLVRYFAAA